MKKKNFQFVIITVIFFIILGIILFIINKDKHKDKYNYIFLNQIDNFEIVDDKLFEKDYIGSKSYNKLITHTIKESIGNKKYKYLGENIQQVLFDIGDIMAKTAYYDIEQSDKYNENSYILKSTLTGPAQLFRTILRTALNLAKWTEVISRRGSLLKGNKAFDIPEMQILLPQLTVLHVMPFNINYNLSGSLTSLGGLIGKVPGTNKYISAFRGTSNLTDVIEDVKFIPIPFADVFLEDDAKVHTGFVNIFSSPRNDLTLLSPLEIFRNWVLSLPEFPEDDFMFYSTGHSLGAAEALLATCLFLKERPRYRDRIITHTYGCPDSIILNNIALNNMKILIENHQVYMWANIYDPIPRLSKVGELLEYSSISEFLPHRVSKLVNFDFEPESGEPLVKYHYIGNYIKYLEDEVKKEDIELK
jgi:hypothetical protein